MKIVKVDSKEPSRKYPYLGEYKNKSFVVLFTSPSCGVVVEGESVYHNIGEYHKNWEESIFEPFNGKIVLTND